MQISYYCYRAVSADNLDFILSMPNVLKLTYNDVDLHIAHSSEEFIADCEHKEWSTSQVAKRYMDKDVTSDSFRADIHNYFDNNDRFQQIFSELEQGCTYLVILIFRRIPFDMEEYIDVLIKSDQFVKANVWSKIIIQELKTAREHLSFFLRFAEEYADKIDDKRHPFMLDTWEKAYELWIKQ